MAATSLEQTNTFCSLKTFNATLNESKSIFELIRCLHLTVENIVAGIGHISLNNTNHDNCIWEIKNGENQPTVTISFDIEDRTTQVEVVNNAPDSVAEYIEVEENHNTELNEHEKVKPQSEIESDNLLIENTTYVNLIPDDSFHLSWKAEQSDKEYDETFIKAVVMEENQMLHKPLDTVNESCAEEEVEVKETEKAETSELEDTDSESILSEKNIQQEIKSPEKLTRFKQSVPLIEKLKIEKIENIIGNNKSQNVGKSVKLIAKTVDTSFQRQTRNSTKRQEIENNMGGRPTKAPKKFPCQYCSKKFTRKYDMMMHHRIHTGEKPYACRFCEKRFSQMNNKEVHERIHTGEKPYSCSYCEQTFTQTADKKKHERIHTGERPYVCIHCGKAFTRLDHKKSHERTHTGEKPFTCKICGKRFTDSSTKGAHEKRHMSTSQLTEESIILICTQ